MNFTIDDFYNARWFGFVYVCCLDDTIQEFTINCRRCFCTMRKFKPGEEGYGVIRKRVIDDATTLFEARK